MTKDNLARIAFGCAFGVIWGLVLLRNGGDIIASIEWWLLGAICCGIALNTQEGSQWWILAIGAIASSFAMACALEIVLVVKPVTFMLSEFNPKNILQFLQHSIFKSSGIDPSTGMQLVIAGVFAVSALGAFIASYGRPMFLSFLKGFIHSEETLIRVEKSINLLIKVIGAGVLLFKGLT